MPGVPTPTPTLAAGVVPGLTATATLTVTEADTALGLGSGDVPVLATPRLVALCEEASCKSLGGRLGAERTSVASRIQFDHLLPVPVGCTVIAEATVDKVEGRRLGFTISAILRSADRTGLVAAGRLSRVVVEREPFLAKAGCGGPSGGCSEPAAPRTAP